MNSALNPPPLCNTGVEKSVSLVIDWIEGTYKHNEARRPIPLILTEESIECTAFHGYSVGRKYQDGRIEMTNPMRPDMGLHIQWSGITARSGPVDSLSLVAYLAATGFTFTRLDFAVDARGWDLKPQRATELIADGKYKCRAQKFPHWGDAKNPGYTQYVGTKASEIHCRIYDKASEMGKQGDYTRVELVVRGKRAKKAAEMVLRGNDFRQLVLGYIRFQEWPEWDEVMGADAVTIPAEKTESATKKWLLSQCAPALARILDEDEDDAFWFEFLKQVQINRG